MNFTAFHETSDLIKGVKTNQINSISFKTDLLRSNCRVTNQPDWGDLFFSMKSNFSVDLTSVVSYLVSFRQENHFHEEVVEMIYKRFHEKFQPEELLVAAMYTRRGGIDINPIRVSNPELIDKAFSDQTVRIKKNLRQ